VEYSLPIGQTKYGQVVSILGFLGLGGLNLFSGILCQVSRNSGESVKCAVLVNIAPIEELVVLDKLVFGGKEIEGIFVVRSEVEGCQS